MMQFNHAERCILCLFYHAASSSAFQLIDSKGINNVQEGLPSATINSLMTYQTTIEKPVATKGVGLHTAVKSHLRLVPAPANTGIVFRRVDLDNFEIEAHVRNVARVSYATSLMKKGVLLSTTEHLLAALYSCGVDNVYVEIDALELPILDGSSQPFIEMLAEAGIRRLRKRRRYLKIVKPLEISEGDRRIGIYPANDFRVSCHVHYANPAVGTQEIELVVGRESFSRMLAPARTFGFVQDFEGLRRMGLIRGGSLENAIVLNEGGVMNGPLRFPDEFGRHKALDLIGDLALVGRPLLARVEAYKAGHALHTQLVTRLLADPSLWTETYDEAPSKHSQFPAQATVSAAD
jgi:UDP-3-O-[3-hydroxymyristoyl] N-acetylglucosamine deacetylase